MADFKVQRGTATITSAATSVTITAGTDYVAPAALANAFIRITAVGHRGASGTNGGGDCRYYTGLISNPANLLTSITFNRQSGAGGVALIIDWEIVEYIGAAGGANEFLVRKHEALTYTSTSDTKSGGAMTASVVSDAKVAVFITSQRSGSGGGFDDRNWQSTAAWNTGSQIADFTRSRGSHDDAAQLSYAVVEFTGSNWTVQRVSHSYTAANTEETETVSGATLAKSFIHVQNIPGTQGKECDCWPEVWLSATTTVSFKIPTGATVTGKTTVAWVVTNAQSGTGAANCQRKNGSYNDGTNQSVTITAVADMVQSSVIGIAASTVNTSAATFGVCAVGLTLTSTTNVQVRSTFNASESLAYRFEVFEWPTAPASGGLPPGILVASRHSGRLNHNGH